MKNFTYIYRACLTLLLVPCSTFIFAENALLYTTCQEIHDQYKGVTDDVINDKTDQGGYGPHIYQKYSCLIKHGEDHADVTSAFIDNVGWVHSWLTAINEKRKYSGGGEEGIIELWSDIAGKPPETVKLGDTIQIFTDIYINLGPSHGFGEEITVCDNNKVQCEFNPT